MPGYSDPGFDTLALHAGAAPDAATGARAVPIYLTTSFVFESSDHAAALFNLERAGHVYSRISNPTNAVLEQRVSALEGGIDTSHFTIMLAEITGVSLEMAVDPELEKLGTGRGLFHRLTQA